MQAAKPLLKGALENFPGVMQEHELDLACLALDQQRILIRLNFRNK